MTRPIHRPAPADRSPPLIAHVERHLGKIARRSYVSSDGGVQAVIVESRPTDDATSYVTLGLSNHVLAAASGRQVRQELLGASYSRFAELNPEANLLTVAHNLLEAHRAALRGNVIGPAGPITPGSSLEAYYCAPPPISPTTWPHSGEVCPRQVLSGFFRFLTQRHTTFGSMAGRSSRTSWSSAIPICLI